MNTFSIQKLFILFFAVATVAIALPSLVFAQGAPTMLTQSMTPTYSANVAPTIGDAIVPGQSTASNTTKINVEIVKNPRVTGQPSGNESVCKWLGYAESTTNWYAPYSWAGNCDDTSPRTTGTQYSMKFTPWRVDVGDGTPVYLDFQFANSLLPTKIIVMMGFELEPSAGGSLGANAYSQTRNSINVGAGTMESYIRSGAKTRAQVNSLVTTFKNEGKLYIESVRSDRCFTYYDPSNCTTTNTPDGQLTTNADKMERYWSAVLDNYDGIIIDEYTESFTYIPEGQTTPIYLDNTLETLRRIRANPAYQNKVIMAAMVQSLGFSSCSHPSGCPYRQDLFTGLNTYTDRIFYESYINETGLSSWPAQLNYMDNSRNFFASNGTIPLSKIIYGLYIPQTAERADTAKDVYVIDNSPEISIGSVLEDQIQKLKTANYSTTAGVGYWIYYRANTHIAKATSFLATHYLTNGNTSRQTPAYNVSALLTNGSFESAGSGSLPANWTSGNVGTSANVTRENIGTSRCTGTIIDGVSMAEWCGRMQLGAHALKLTHGSGYAIASQSATVEAGKSYVIKGFFQAVTGFPKATVKIIFNDPTKTTYSKNITTNSYWNLLSFAFSAPSNATQATISIESSCGTNTAGFYADWLQLEKVPYASDSDFLTTNAGSCIGTTAAATTQNPTAIWHMDDSGDTVLDASGNSNHGTAFGSTPNTTSPKFGTASRNFDGNEDYVTTPLQTTDTLTVSAWATHSGSNLEFLWATSRSDGVGVSLMHYAGGLWLYTLTGPVGSEHRVCDAPSNMNNGAWHHYVAIISPTSTKIYYDGALCGTRGGGYVDPSGTFRISNSYQTTSWTGKIDEVLTYERILTDGEITALYTATSGYAVPTPTPTSGPTNTPTPSPTQGPTPTPIVGSGVYMNLPGGGGNPGILFTGDSSVDFGEGQASNTNWIVGGFTYPEVYKPSTPGVFRTSYEYLSTVARQSGITPTDLSTVCTLSNCTLPVNVPNGVYQANSNVLLNTYTFPVNKNYVILVNGTLTINGTIKVPAGSTATFSAVKDIIVNKNVGQNAISSTSIDLEGYYSAGENFVLDGTNNCAVGPDKRINIAGAVIVNTRQVGGTFQNKRDLCEGNLQCPTFMVIDRPDFLTNFPQFMRVPNFIWKEVAP